MPLRDGSEPADPRLDRLDDKDPRSRAYSVSAWHERARPAPARSYTWRNNVQLDQGGSGACVGFAWTHELTARPAEVRGLDSEFARESVYFRAQQIDRFPGGAYPGALPFSEGTSVIAGAKAVQALGYIEEYRWAFDLDDLVWAVGHRGPAVFGCRWYARMQTPTAEGRVVADGARIGKHCVLLYGIKAVRGRDGVIDERQSYFKLQNSFGRDWGIDGRAMISLADVRRLWPGAETCIPVLRRRQRRGESA